MTNTVQEREQVQNLINLKMNELLKSIRFGPDALAQSGSNGIATPNQLPKSKVIVTTRFQNQPETAIVPERLIGDESLLYRRGYEKVLAPAEKLNHKLFPVGISPIFEERRLYQSQSCLWALMPLEKDPVIMEDGELRIPSYQLKQLRKLQKGGVSPDRLYIAHELPLDTIDDPEKITAAMVRHKPPPGAEKMAKRLGLAGSIILRTATAPAVIAGMVGAAALGTVFAAGASAGSAILLDPILFGVVVSPGRTPRSGEKAMWFELMRWCV